MRLIRRSFHVSLYGVAALIAGCCKFSPDVLCVRGDPQSPATNELRLMQPDGSEDILLAKGAWYPAWPPLSQQGGKRNHIAYVVPPQQVTLPTSDQFALRVVDRSGTTDMAVTNAEIGQNFAWSPDQKWIAVEKRVPIVLGEPFLRWTIFKVEVSTGQFVQLTNSQEYNDRDPAWSRDGSKIAFVRERIGSSYSHIWVMNADGSGEQQLTQGSSASNDQPVWEGASKRIVFLRRHGSAGGGPTSQMMMVDAATKSETELTTLQNPALGNLFDVWGPFVYFVRGRTLYRVNMNTPLKEQLLKHLNKDCVDICVRNEFDVLLSLLDPKPGYANLTYPVIHRYQFKPDGTGTLTQIKEGRHLRSY